MINDKLVMYAKKAIILVLALSYYIFVVLSHELVSQLFIWAQNTLTNRVYNLTITLVVIVSALITVFYSYRGLKKAPHKSYFMFLTAVITITAYNTIMVKNVESIHFLQYFILTIPLFIIIKHFGLTLLLITFLGAIDEGYQYFILYAKSRWYFDFNDIVLNMVGGICAITVIYTMSNNKQLPFESFKKWLKTPTTMITVTILLFVVFGMMSGLMVFDPAGASNSDAPIILNSRPLEGMDFWITFEWTETYMKTFHVLRPVEGVFVIAFLMLVYSLMDYSFLKANRDR